MPRVSDWETKYEQVFAAAERIRQERQTAEPEPEEPLVIQPLSYEPAPFPRTTREALADKMARVYTDPKAREWIYRQFGVEERKEKSDGNGIDGLARMDGRG